jgi:hypothetical protein
MAQGRYSVRGARKRQHCSQALRIGTVLDRFRETARMVLEPWIVEAALARFAEKRLTPEQEVVVKATRTPAKVRWPDWWVFRP